MALDTLGPAGPGLVGSKPNKRLRWSRPPWPHLGRRKQKSSSGLGWWNRPVQLIYIYIYSALQISTLKKRGRNVSPWGLLAKRGEEWLNLRRTELWIATFLDSFPKCLALVQGPLFLCKQISYYHIQYKLLKTMSQNFSDKSIGVYNCHC